MLMNPKNNKTMMKNFKKELASPTEEKWELEFDLEIQDCLVVHVFDTDQYKKIKSFIATQKELSFEEGLNLRKEYNDPKLLKQIEKKAFEEGVKSVQNKDKEEKLCCPFCNTNTAYGAGPEFFDQWKIKHQYH